MQECDSVKSMCNPTEREKEREREREREGEGTTRGKRGQEGTGGNRRRQEETGGDRRGQEGTGGDRRGQEGTGETGETEKEGRGRGRDSTRRCPPKAWHPPDHTNHLTTWKKHPNSYSAPSRTQQQPRSECDAPRLGIWWSDCLRFCASGLCTLCLEWREGRARVWFQGSCLRFRLLGWSMTRSRLQPVLSRHVLR